MNVKKILDLIFEPVDDEEVVIDKPLERHEFKKEVKKEVPKIVTPKVPQSDEMIAKRAEIKKKDVLDRTYAKRFDVSAEQKRPRHIEKPITKYEPQPALSPIFGVLEKAEDEKESRPHYVPSSNTTTHKSPLGTILSPIYGVIGTENEKEEKEIIKKEDNVKTIIAEQSNVEPLAEDFDTIEMIKVQPEIKSFDKKEDSVSITTILQKPSDSTEDETYISSEDITLFDDLEKK